MRGNWNQIHTYFLPDNGGPPVYLNPDGTPGMAPMLSADEFNAQQDAFRKIKWKKGDHIEARFKRFGKWWLARIL